MVYAVKKLNPTRSVMEQIGFSRQRNIQPVLIHQHPGRISKLVPGLTTDQLPRAGNYARATVKL